MPIMRIPDEDAAKMRAEYEGPAQPSLEEMERRWGWSGRAIGHAIRRAGGILRPQRKRTIMPPPADVLALYESGLSRQELASRIGCTLGALDSCLRRARLATSRSGDTWWKRAKKERHAQWKAARARGETYTAIAARDGVSYQAVRQVVLGLRRGHCT